MKRTVKILSLLVSIALLVHMLNLPLTTNAFVEKIENNNQSLTAISDELYCSTYSRPKPYTI